ncbi:hypothetical protein [Micromonospora rubida]
MVDNFGRRAQGDADHSKVTDTSDNEHGGTQHRDLLDLIAEITGTEIKPDHGNSRLPLPERFEQFHADNPAVYNALRWLALQRKRAGGERFGISAVFERLRWEVAIQTNGDPFLIDNSFRSFYARMIMAQEAELRDMFVTRSSIADEWIAGRTDLGQAA